jgi:hypothetical protein
VIASARERSAKTSMNATSFQREIVDRKVRSVARAEADEKLFFSILAIGLGLIAAIPTGGGSLVLAGIAAAAAAAGDRTPSLSRSIS